MFIGDVHDLSFENCSCADVKRVKVFFIDS